MSGGGRDAKRGMKRLLKKQGDGTQLVSLPLMGNLDDQQLQGDSHKQHKRARGGEKQDSTAGTAKTWSWGVGGSKAGDVQVASAASVSATRDDAAPRDDCHDGHGVFEGDEYSDEDVGGFSTDFGLRSDVLSGYKTQMRDHGLLEAMDTAGMDKALIGSILLPTRMHSASRDVSNEMAFFAVPDYNRQTGKLNLKSWLQTGFSILQNGTRVFFCNCCDSGMVAYNQAEMQRCISGIDIGAEDSTNIDPDISSCDCDHTKLIIDAMEGKDATIVQMIMDSHRSDSELRLVGVFVGVRVCTRVCIALMCASLSSDLI
jgi:hypothetical protein